MTDVGAVVGAARKVRDKLLRIAAHCLEVAVEALELVDGEARVRGVPGGGLPLRGAGADRVRRRPRPAAERGTVVRVIRKRLQLEPTGRPAKSTASLIEKLRRESIRLVQVQDIAGCRIVVDDVIEQERVVTSLRELFPAGSVVDRRTDPSYGYRAVHVIVQISGKSVEIQIRTSLQHLWAELSEKLSDAGIERTEVRIEGLMMNQTQEQQRELLHELQYDLVRARMQAVAPLDEALSLLEKLRKERHDLPD